MGQDVEEQDAGVGDDAQSVVAEAGWTLFDILVQKVNYYIYW